MLISRKIIFSLAAFGALVITGAVVIGLQSRTVSLSLAQADAQLRNGSIYGDLERTARLAQVDVIQVQQFLTDASATHNRGSIDEAGKFAADFPARAKHIQDVLAQLAAQGDKADLGAATDGVAAAVAAFPAFHQTGIDMANAYIANGLDAGNKMMENFDSTSAAIFKSIDGLVDETQKLNIAAQQLTEDLNGKANAAQDQAAATGYLVDALMLGLFAAVAGFIFLQVVRPISRITAVMREVAGNNLTITVPGVDRRDEIGFMAQSLLIFRDNARTAQHLRAEQERAREVAEEEKRAALETMASTVERETRHAVDVVAEQSLQLAKTASNMSRSAGAVSENSQSVASAAAEALANAQTVASASEELSASIREISNQIQSSKVATGEAVTASGGAQSTIGELSSAVGEISAVTRLISEIASQTNLLALNATIEAARAGDAGKGFAVVANEVKSLANQTGKATEDITRQIAAVQLATERAVAAVDTINNSIHSIEALSATIASAVEQQSAATSEIARNVSQTSDAAQEVSLRIVEVSQEASLTGNGAQDVSRISHDVSDSIDNLRKVLIRVVRTATKEVDRRQYPRYAIARPGEARIAGQVMAITVQNCSEGGAMLSGLTQAVAANAPIELKIDGIASSLRGSVLLAEDDRLHLEFDTRTTLDAGFLADFRRLVGNMPALRDVA
jgi:methyl-accepting chemotaxis protein